MTTLKKNIFANYVSQLYVTLVSLGMLPVYIKYMGAEAYGLVGFFAMMQAWFIILDMGLTLTMSRETARFRANATDPASYNTFVRTLEALFLTIALIGGIAIFCAADFISVRWLNANHLAIAEIKGSIELMAGIVALRWISGLYRGVIRGAEQMVWLGWFNGFIETLRFVSVLLVFKFLGTQPMTFFSYQLLVAAIELIILIFKASQIFPKIPNEQKLPWSFDTLKPAFKFYLSLALPTIGWVLVTQTDKLVLSKILSLTNYGYFSLAVFLASVVMMITEPISTAILPRMTKLEAEKDEKNLIHLYRQSTQTIVILAGTAAVTISVYAKPLLLAWTGDPVLAAQAAPILVLYAIGNAILAICAFPFYLQYAKGDLKLHLIGNTIFIAFLIPAMIWATRQYGGIGAGYAWICVHLLNFILWIPFVHKKFVPGLNWKWYGQDIFAILIMIALAGYVLNHIPLYEASSLGRILQIILFTLLLLAMGTFASSAAKENLKKWRKTR